MRKEQAHTPGQMLPCEACSKQAPDPREAVYTAWRGQENFAEAVKFQEGDEDLRWPCTACALAFPA